MRNRRSGCTAPGWKTGGGWSRQRSCTTNRMACESGLPAIYDAHYLALAHRLNAEFWTADRRLFQAVQGRIPKIHLLEMG